MRRNSSSKKIVETHPALFGALIGVVLMGMIVAIVIWFPRIGDAWDRHDKLVRSVWCTLALFAVCIYRLSRWRHRRGFWLTLSVFFALHTAGVVLYSTYVHALLLQEWVILLLLEAMVIVFLLDPVLQRLKSPE
jgi:hypothetical protein